MTNWTSGYVTEIGYTHGYYRELCPVLLGLAVLSKGYHFPFDEPLRYLELGFGQGLSVNIHAAACPGEFWGTDFNPAQAAHAKELRTASGAEAHLFDHSFAELAARDDLPEFDIIALHGIWSWISDENRAIIVDIARRKLVTGGLLYISYNCTPGWSPAMPLRHLMALHGERSSARDLPIATKLDAAIAFTQQVIDAGALYFRANPAVAERLKKLKEQNRNYLAHEYFTRDWHIKPFSDVSDQLSQAKLGYAGSANLLEHVDQISLTSEGQALLAPIENTVLRESVRDYLMNTQFRKDIFIKGGTRLRPLEQAERFRGQGFILTASAADVPMKLPGPLGEFSLNVDIYSPLIAALAEKEHAPKTIAELQAHHAGRDKALAQLVQAMTILTGAGYVQPVQNAEVIKAAKATTKALNTHICQKARYSGDIAALASPVTGGGVPIGRFQQLFLLARRRNRGKTNAKICAEFAWDYLRANGERLLRDGKPIDSPEENLTALIAQAEAFEVKQLPILTALGVEL